MPRSTPGSRRSSRVLPYLLGGLLVITVALLALVLGRTDPQLEPRDQVSSGGNPFGVSIDPRWPLDQRITIAKELGVRYFRTEEVYVRSWDENPVCEACQAALDAGMEITWTVRNTTKPEVVRPPDPSAPAIEIGEYQRVIREVLDKYPIALLVVENEASLTQHFTGTPAQYETMLRAACEVAHERDIPCASDGMLSNIAQRYAHFYLSCVVRDPDRSEAFRQNLRELSPNVPCQGTPVDAWIEAYKSAQPDFVNIHWYSEPGADPARDAAAFAEAVRVFEEATGRPVITNEAGQRDDDPDVTMHRMRVVMDIGMPFFIWYSVGGNAGVLAERDGTLRPLGEAFKMVIEEGS